MMPVRSKGSFISAAAAALLLTGCGQAPPGNGEAGDAVSTFAQSTQVHWLFSNACYRAFGADRYAVRGATVTSIGSRHDMTSWWENVGYVKDRSWPVTVKVFLSCGEGGSGKSLTVEEHWYLRKYSRGWSAFNL